MQPYVMIHTDGKIDSTFVSNNNSLTSARILSRALGAYIQWRSKVGEQLGARAPGRRLGGALTHFIQPFKTHFKQKYRPKYA